MTGARELTSLLRERLVGLPSFTGSQFFSIPSAVTVTGDLNELLARITTSAAQHIGVDCAFPANTFEWRVLEEMFPELKQGALFAGGINTFIPAYLPAHKIIIMPMHGIGSIITTPGAMITGLVHELGHACERARMRLGAPVGLHPYGIEYALGEIVAEGCCYLLADRMTTPDQVYGLHVHHLRYMRGHLKTYITHGHGSLPLLDMILSSDSFNTHLANVCNDVWNILDKSQVEAYTLAHKQVA